ncbi:MAG: hypothetical protein Q4G06_00455 [Clostridia bacterium]|nr:hypothetical protein [Clostridia bacterium]
MNAFLSILVCIAMLFSGGATLPAQPETATVRTLRNLSVTTDEDSVTLTPELRLTTAIGSEAALMQFEVVNGDDVLLPMAGELTGDGVRFRLCDGGSVYSLTNDALLELMEADDADAQLMAWMVDYLNSYSALLSRTMTDASFQQEISRTMIELLVSTCGGSAEPVTVELDGAEIPAQRAQLELTPEASLDLLDGLASCGVTEIEDMLNSYMLLLASTMGEDYASLSDLTADLRAQLAEEGMADEISFPMELTWTTEDPAHIEIAMDFDVDDTSAMQLSVTSTSADERTDLDMTLGFAMDDGMGNTNQMDFHMTECVDGPLNAPENVELHLVASSQNDWKSEYSEEGAEAVAHSYVSSSAMNLALDVNAAVVDGLEHATIDLTASQSSSYDYDGDVNSDESGLSAHISSDDRSEADGSVTAAVAMDVEADGESMQISWELNRAEGMPVPAFDETKTVDLAEIIREDEDSAASIALASDALKLSADATALCADESVLAMLELLEIEPDEMPADVTVSEDGDDESEEIYLGDDDTVTVYSMDEAAAIYAGALPAFTVPEGLELDEIYVSEAYLDAYYSSADGERYLDLSCFDYGYSHGEFYVLEDGALVPAGAVINIDVLDEENTSFSADVGVPTGMCSFSFYGFAREEVESFLTTLQF